MITVRMSHYNDEEQKFIKNMISMDLITLQKDCDKNCKECKVRMLCDDLERTHTYINKTTNY